ncbi:beta-d-xylosidase 4, partial [Plakobranchus ocellatus]
INGVPACANPKLLTDILRKEWGFKGYVVSDQGAIENIISYHKYLKTKADTVAACVSAGCNLELSSNLEDAVYMHLEQAVKMGKLTEAVVRERVKPLFYTRMRLGEFDPPETNPYWSLGEEQVETPAHQALAVTAAAQSYVLLKNENDLLPLDEGRFKNVALIGPMSDNWRQLFSTYSANQPRNYTKTPLDALKQVYPNIRYGKACMDNTTCTVYHSDVVGQTVQNAELVFVALGTGIDVEREGKDRPNVNLPGHQKQLLLDVISQVGSDAKVILLLFNAGPLNITFADVNPRVDAILECFFPGQGTGEAIINVLFNKGGNSSPAGRLPMTWPKYAWQIPPMVNYSMSGRTYRYLHTEPLYPFGYGLSYTQFGYSNLTAATSHPANLDLEATVHVTNTGKLDADEVVQCYVGPSQSPPYPIPRRSLGYFQRVHLSAGHRLIVSATLAKETWAGTKCSVIYREIVENYGEPAMSMTQVYQWCSWFKDSRTSLQNEPRSGRPNTANNDRNTA